MENQLKKANAEKKKLKEEIKCSEENKFTEKYGISFQDAYKEYVEIVRSGLGVGQGYQVWLDELREGCDNDYSGNEEVVIKPEHYERCLPSDQDKEAYYLVHGDDMIISKDLIWTRETGPHAPRKLEYGKFI